MRGRSQCMLLPPSHTYAHAPVIITLCSLPIGQYMPSPPHTHTCDHHVVQRAHCMLHDCSVQGRVAHDSDKGLHTAVLTDLGGGGGTVLRGVWLMTTTRASTPPSSRICGGERGGGGGEAAQCVWGGGGGGRTARSGWVSRVGKEHDVLCPLLLSSG